MTASSHYGPGQRRGSYGDLSIAFSRAGPGITVRVIGEVDGQTAPFLRDRLIDVIDGQGNRSVAVDISGMTFIDSAGLSTLVELDGRARDRGAVFALHNPRPTTSRVFDIAGLTQILTIR